MGQALPNPMPGQEGVIEIRPIFGPEDFGEAMTPELKAKEEELRKKTERKSAK